MLVARLLPAAENEGMKALSNGRRVTSVVVIGLGFLFLVPPTYATIEDWRGASNELAWAHLRDMLPVCSIPALLCFAWAWRIRHPKKSHN